jgi:hypothetical protein
MSSQHEGQAAEGPDLVATHSAWAPFASRAFFWLWLANTVSAVGTWIQNTASAWIMTDLAPSPMMVSLVQAAAQLPVLLLASRGPSLEGECPVRHLRAPSSGCAATMQRPCPAGAGRMRYVLRRLPVDDDIRGRVVVLVAAGLD